MTEPNWKLRATDTELVVQNFINGAPVDIGSNNLDPDTRVISKFSPRDGQPLYQFGAGSKADVEQAVNNARATFEEGVWQRQTIQQRKQVLQKLADLIEDNKETLALYDCLDVGKPITHTLQEDIPLAAMTFRDCAEKADKLLSPSGSNGSTVAYQIRKPVGVVGSIVGWNFPLWMAAIKAAPALVMGNSLVLKPSEFSPLSATTLAALAIEAGLPPGVFNVVQGAGSIVGAALAHHDDVNLISFTGSSATGKQIMTAAGQSNMKRIMLECGGKSPYIVFDDCPDNLDMIAGNIVDMAFRNQGEWCCAGSRLLIQSSIKEQLVPKIIERAKLLKPQDPLDPATTFGALVNEEHMHKVLRFIEAGQQEGAELILGGQRVLVGTDSTANAGGYYIEPTIFDKVQPQHTIAQEEIFGPVLSILSFDDEDEAIALANSTRYGLAAYLATENLGRAQRLGQALNTGGLIIIGSSTPSGGNVDIGSEAHRESGFGFETGLAGLESYTVSTAVHSYI